MGDAKTRMSDEAVASATGRSWDDWFALLDAGKADALDHKSIVALLEDEIDGMWWRQSVAVEYEKARGLRVTGETAGGTFQIGAQKSISISAAAAWKLLVSPAGIAVWLGDGVVAPPRKGARFATSEGITGEFRVVSQGSHFRLAWQLPGWKESSTLQLRVIPKAPDKSVISFHHEGLPERKSREEMKRRWQGVLRELEDIMHAE